MRKELGTAWWSACCTGVSKSPSKAEALCRKSIEDHLKYAKSIGLPAPERSFPENNPDNA